MTGERIDRPEWHENITHDFDGRESRSSWSACWKGVSLSANVHGYWGAYRDGVCLAEGCVDEVFNRLFHAQIAAECAAGNQEKP